MTLEYYFNDTEFTYEPEHRDLYHALNTLSGLDVYELSDVQVEDLIEEYLEDLERHFYDEAFADFKEQQQYENDPYAFHGVSRKDF